MAGPYFKRSQIPFLVQMAKWTASQSGSATAGIPTSNMRISLSKDDSESNLSGILVHVQVSEIDASPQFSYSHSFRYNIPSGSGNDGEIIVYNNKMTASRDQDGISYSFALEKCRNKDCKKEHPGGCPSIVGRANRILVADVFHTQPTQDTLGYFGMALFKAIFSGVAEQLFKNTEPTHPNARIFLQLNKHEDLDAIPWEYAKDHPTSFLVHQRRFARIYDCPQDPLPKLPLRIVAVVPDPVIPPNEPGANLADLHLSEQFQNFKDGFVKNNKKVKLERVFPPTVSQMGALLDTKTAASTVLHFMGHCGQDEENNSRALIFEHGVTGKLEYINASHLVSVSKNLRLAFLSACDSRDVARILVEHGVRYTISSDCHIPDDLARKFEFEFYKFLANGYTVEMAMYQARASFQVKGDIRQSNYFAGAMVLYLSTVSEDDGAFQCDEGAPDINTHEPQNNLMVLHTTPVIRGRKKELAELYSHLRNMVFKQTRHVCTIKGIDGKGFVAEAMRRMAHLFPGGIFAWAFDKEITSANDYFRHLVKVIFSEVICMRLTEQYGNDVDEFGSAIIQLFQTGDHATCLLILDHADILDLGRKEKNTHAEKLGRWLEKITSVRHTVKILLTSKKPLDWLKGELMDLSSSDIDTEKQGKKNVHKYFAQTKEPIYFHGVPAENLAFVERSDILAKMEATLDSCRTLVLSGLGGMGKTQLMLRYCYLHRATYDYIFWLEVDNWNAAIESFRKLAVRLGIDEKSTKGEDAEKKIIELVRSWFEKETQWLLLLNNCDGDEMDKKVFELLPHVGDGNVILTTRLFNSSKKATVIRVDKMQEDEALYLLLDVGSIDKESAEIGYARDIIVKLDRMPLAIALACAYIKENAIPLQRYLNMLQEEKKRIKLFKYSDDDDNYKHTVATVWQLSFERIRAFSPTAVRILEACAFLQPENIPVNFFKKQYSVLQLTSSPSVNKLDSEQFLDDIETAITVLVKFSFVMRKYNEVEDDKENPASDLLTIHRLVQKVIYDAMNSDQVLHWAHSIPRALTEEIYFSNPHAQDARKALNSYLAHIRHFATLLDDFGQQSMISDDLVNLLNETIEQLCDNGMYFSMGDSAQLLVRFSEMIYVPENPATATSLNNLARLYFGQGKYGEIEPLYQRALAIREKVLGSEHLDTGASLNNLALLYSSQGKYDKARPLHLRDLAIRENVLGSEHPDTATSLSHLALLYFRQGKYDEAEPLHRRALKIREKVLGSEHLDTATSLNDLAVLYDRQGKYDEAEPLYRRDLAICEKELGSEHPNTGASLNGLAGLYVSQGKYDKAEPLHQRALAICEKMLGSEHPDTGASLNDLALLYGHQGRYDEAEPLCQRALAIREKAFGPEHPDTATSLKNLASLCDNQGKHDEAEPLYQRALAIREKVFGSEHPDTRASLNDLALLYDRQRKYDKAEQLRQRALEISKKMLGSEHPYTVTSLNNPALLCDSQGKYDEAEPLYQGAPAIHETVFGLEHLDTATSLDNLALLYDSKGKYDEAALQYQRALTIREKILGSEHPDATSLDNLALLYANQSKYDEAESLYQQALAIREKILGLEHPDTATSLDNLAFLYTNHGKYDEAEPLCQRALTIREKLFGSEHPDTATSLNTLALLYDSQSKYDEAKPVYQRALAIREEVLGPEHPDTATSLDNLALLYTSQSKYDEAEPLCQRALAIREKVFGSGHPVTATSLNNLALLYDPQNKYDEAGPLYLRALAICEKAMGSEHPDTVTLLTNLALLYDRQGKYNEAEPLFQRALAIREKISGSEHLDTATLLNNFARLYENQCKYDEAEPLYQRALAICKKMLGSEHPDTAVTLKNLVNLCNNYGRNNEATDAAKGHQDNTTAQSETATKTSDRARGGTAVQALEIRDTENLLPEERKESPNKLKPSSNDNASSSESPKKKGSQRGSDDDGMIWKTALVAVSAGAVICIVWLLWIRRRLQR